MALCSAGITEGLSFLRNELPVVALGMQREFQRAKRDCREGASAIFEAAPGRVVAILEIAIAAIRINKN